MNLNSSICTFMCSDINIFFNAGLVLVMMVVVQLVHIMHATTQFSFLGKVIRPWAAEEQKRLKHGKYFFPFKCCLHKAECTRTACLCIYLEEWMDGWMGRMEAITHTLQVLVLAWMSLSLKKREMCEFSDVPSEMRWDKDDATESGDDGCCSDNNATTF